MYLYIPLFSHILPGLVRYGQSKLMHFRSVDCEMCLYYRKKWTTPQTPRNLSGDAFQMCLDVSKMCQKFVDAFAEMCSCPGLMHHSNGPVRQMDENGGQMDRGTSRDKPKI